MMNAEDLTENIVDSTESIEGFKNIAPDLIRELFLGPKSNIRTFVNVVSSILTSDDESPMNKFYGLYLLLKTCEGNPNDIFIDELGSKEELIAEIFKTAQFDASKKGASLEKGKTYFSESPSEEEACIGINYVRLAIEVIVYCGTHFGTQDMTESNYNFWFKMESLSKRMQLPSTYWFIEKNYYGDEEVASWNFNTKPLPFTPTNASTSTKPTQPIQPTPIANVTSIPTANIATSQKVISSQPTANIITSQKLTSSQPSAIPTANITTSQKIVSSQPTPTTPTSSNPLKISAFEKLNDPKLMKSRNDLSTTSANVSLLDDKSMEKKTLGMRMAEMGMFTDDKRQRSRSPTPTAASRRDKTPDKTQDIRNFFNERERAAQQTKTTPVKSWQSIDTDPKAINEPPKSNQSIPTHSHQSSRQMSDIPQDPFSRVLPETRGREPQRVQASYVSNDRMYNEDRVKSNVMPNQGYVQERKETSPYLKEGSGAAGWNGFERVNPKPENPGRATTPRSGAQVQSQQIQQGFDFNRADNRNMGTSDDSVYKEKYRAATAENDNMKRENTFLKDELERLKKELYAKTTNEENLVKENRSLKAEVNHFQSQRGDRSEALTRENNILKAKFTEYEQRLGDMTNALTAISYENKQLKASLEEKERELEESRDVPVRHVVFPGSNPFFTPEPQVQERRNDPPVSVPVLGGGYQSKGPYTLGAYNTPERFNQYPEGGSNMYGGDIGRRGDEGMFFSSGMEQGGGAGKKGIFERVKYDKPGMVLSKDNPYQ